MTVQESKQIKEYAEMYARNLVLYGVDVRDKLESATSISFALGQAYTKGRNDECKRFESAMAELQTYRALGTVEEVTNQKHNLSVAYKIIDDYSKIGTVEELKEAREKQIRKKIEVFNGQASCPNCHKLYGNMKDIKKLIAWEMPHCKYCGQALKWGEEDE